MIIDSLLFWLLTAFGLWVVTRLVRGVRAKTGRSLLLAALVLGLVNIFVRPLLWILTLPLTVVTFGFFALVVNALMIQFTAWIVPDFEVDGFGSALLAALVMVVLAIVALVVSQWLGGGTIHWMYYKEVSNGVYF